MKMNFGVLSNSLDSWRLLVALRMKPAIAYMVAKYAKQIGEECDLINQQRETLIRDLTGTKPGQAAKIEEGTEMHAEFMRQYAEIMGTECNVTMVPMKLMEVIDSIVESEAAALTPQDMLILDQFFVQESPEEEFRNDDGTPKEAID